MKPFSREWLESHKHLEDDACITAGTGDLADFVERTRSDTPVCTDVMSAQGYFNWGWKGTGFGQFSFSHDPETGKWSCSNELMGPESSRKLLHAFADFVADNLTPVIEEDRRQLEARWAREDELRELKK